MWIKTQDGSLLNLCTVTNIYVKPPGETSGEFVVTAVLVVSDDAGNQEVRKIGAFATADQAQCEMNKLERHLGALAYAHKN